MAQANIDRTYFVTNMGGIDIKVTGVTRAEANDLADKIEALLAQWNADHEEPRAIDEDPTSADDA